MPLRYSSVSDFLFPSSFLVKKSYSIFFFAFLFPREPAATTLFQSRRTVREKETRKEEKYSCIFFDLCIEPRVSWAKTNPNWLRFRSLTTREVCIKGTSYGEEANSWSQSVREPTIEVFLLEILNYKRKNEVSCKLQWEF